jgi:hypothetical protein
MSAKTLAELALKIWGVVLLLGALFSLPAALWMTWIVPTGEPQAGFIRASQIGYLLSVVVQALAGIVVLVWADRIVALFESNDTPLQIDMSSAQLQVLAFAILGVFILIDGLQNAAAAGYALFTRPEQVDTVSYMWARQGESMIKGAVKIAAGAFLVFGREAVARGWSRLRGEGAADAADSNRQ